MQLRKEPYTPIWRDPEYLRRRERDGRFRFLPAGLTVACGLCLALPARFDYDQAISFQLAEGALTARLLFALMFLTLGFLTVRLWRWECRLASVATFAIALALGIIATTDPLSGTHNQAFILLSLLVCAGHAGLYYAHMDARLLLTGLGSLLGLIACFRNLGMGERVLIASSCATLNVLYYDYFDP